MAIEENELSVQPYVREDMPDDPDSLRDYLAEELWKIERTLHHILQTSIQVAETEPENSQKGMIRHNKLPWDPLGDGSEGLVWYDGSSWQAV